MISYIDTGICNLGSLARAFQTLGVTLKPISRPSDFEFARAIILPGVGAFGDGMAGLRGQGLVEPLQQAARSGKPLFGICLGMQLLFESSDEHGKRQGLGLLQGQVQLLDTREHAKYRVPNIGWCDVTPTRDSWLFPKNSGTKICYFVHSYCVAPAGRQTITATIDYAGQAVPAAIEQDNLLGLQFHPEKSQDEGFAILSAFVDGLYRSGRWSS